MKQSPIKALISLSQSDYQMLYDSLLIQLAKKSGSRYYQLIENISNCLKRRRAYLLPLSADSETIYRQQEVWTYAIFTAALWFYCPHIDDIKTIMPEMGLSWLKRHGNLFSIWSDYLAGKENIFSELVGKHRVQDERVYSSEDVHQDPKTTGKDFFDWTIDCINASQLQYIHRIDVGYLINIPEALHAYSNSFDIETISDSQKLMKNEEGGAIHHYCWGDWKNRNTISGIIIPSDKLPGLKQEPGVNSELTPDPMALLSAN